jgi:ADP-ribose pyrophosphatase
MALELWQAVGRSVQYVSRIFTVRREHRRSPITGREHVFEVLEAPDWVNVVAVSRSGAVVLVRQYRAGKDSITLEIPGGTVDPGEAPIDAARRELVEETGYEAERWQEIGRVDPNPAFQTNTTFTFLAEGARQACEPHFDETEYLETEERPLHEIPGLVGSAAITHALVVCAFFHLANARPDLLQLGEDAGQPGRRT